MKPLVITGTSTDVGKTVVTAATAVVLEAAGYRVAVCKPAQTGVGVCEAGDLDTVVRLSDPLRRRQYRECARYPEPLAPVVAARRSGLPALTVADVVGALADCTADVVLIEGAGGVAVHLGEGGETILDVAIEVAAPVLVVVPSGLGALNHAALTVDAIRRAGRECIGLVIGSWPDAPGLADITNLDEFPRVTGVPVLGRIPAGAGALPTDRFVAAAPSWFVGTSLGSSLFDRPGPPHT